MTRTRAALVGICLLVLLIAIAIDGHSVESVDVRTYVEMTRGIVLHGLPYLDNGPTAELTALCVRWNIPAHGQTWGVYGPAYPYFGAPFLALGGLRLLTAATCLLVVPIALVTFFLARRVVEDETHALFAAATTTFATPTLAKSLEATAYPLAALCAVGATYAAVCAISVRGRRRIVLSLATGAIGSLGAAAHLLDMPIVAALILVLAVTDATDPDRRGPALIEKTPLASFWPTRASLLSAACAMVAFLVCALPVAALNARRFGAYNPWSYGPTPWRGAHENALAQQNIGAHLRYAKPCLLFGVILVVALLATYVLPRRRALARIAVVVGAAVALAIFGELREKTIRYAITAFAFVIDPNAFGLKWPYTHAPTGFAYLWVGWLTKSTLQCTPMIALVAATLLGLRRMAVPARHRIVVTLAPGAALYGYLCLRANLPLEDSIGFSLGFIRYTLPALPMLVVAATVTVREIAPKPKEILTCGMLVGAMGIGLCLHMENALLHQQLILLVLPLLCAAGALVTVFLHRRGGAQRAAPWAMALVCAMGFGIGISHDLFRSMTTKEYLDKRVLAVARVVPARFALMGDLPWMDPVLALRAERDIEYADVWESFEWTKMRPVYDRWVAQERPVFFLGEGPAAKSPWPDVTFELVDPVEFLYRVVPRTSSSLSD